MALMRQLMVACAVDGFHKGEHHARCSAANFVGVGPETERLGSRGVGLDARDEALQRGVVDGVFALTRSDHERVRSRQVDAFGRRAAIVPSGMSAWPSGLATMRRPSQPLTATAACECRRS